MTAKQAPPRPSEHLVTVYADGRVAKVAPGALLARTGDTVVFHGSGVGKLLLWFPDGLVRPEGKDARLRVAPGKTLTVRVLAEGGKGAFPYVVYRIAERDFAVGASQPKIIILE